MTRYLFTLLLLTLGTRAIAQLPSFPGTPTNWHGYERHTLSIHDKSVTVVAPTRPAPGRPWVWHGEFFGHKPEPDVALLERGFHIVYVAVPDRFGSPQAVATWNAVYDELTKKYRLSKRAALVGLSRGGLYCFNWAAENPDKVACIYADAPVCDLKSWPLGRGKGTGNKGEVPMLMKVYDANTAEVLLAKALNPIDRLAPLAKARVPLLHVYGDADTGVPWQENTGVVAERYRKLGGDIRLIAKPGVGHVHGLADPSPIIDFIHEHASQPPAHRVIVGWDDAVICCGPGTEAGMDSPQAVAAMVTRWKARGIQGVYWRVNETQLPKPERFVVRNRPQASPPQNYLMARHDRVFESFDLLRTLKTAADQEGLDVWLWCPTLYSTGAPATGPNFTTAWQYESRFGRDHPEVLSVDRAGNKHYMIWEYAYPEARKSKVAEFVEFAKATGFRKFHACMRTEAGQMQPPPKHADQFGFNKPVVDEMKRKYDVDILTDPRFDYAHAKFDPKDPMLENWRRLRGGYLTQFYRELRAELNKVDPKIEIAASMPGDRVGSCLGNWTVDWRTWIDEGLVQELVVGVPLDNHEFHGTENAPDKRGYLPSAVSLATVRDFINKSKHPEVRVIAPGAPSCGYRLPPRDADGWRIDGWFDLWIGNTAERWSQWRGDLAEFGHIKFLAQNFDGVTKADRCDGGFGDVAHRPDLRACPGFWHPIGDGRDGKPHLQDKVRRGDKGDALALVRDAKGANSVTVRHDGRRDRSNYPFPGDTSISSGSCEFSAWLWLAEDSSLVFYLQNDLEPKTRFDVGLYLDAAGNVRYGKHDELVASKVAIQSKQWMRVSLRIDLAKRTYSASLNAEGGKPIPICSEVSYRTGQNAFNTLVFSPQGKTDSVCYLDEVEWLWKPVNDALAPGKQIVVADDFEQLRPRKTIAGERSSQGGTWKVKGDEGDLIVDSDVSFGKGYHSLRFRGRGGSAALATDSMRFEKDDFVTLDCNLFLRSDRPAVWLTPIGEASTTDRTTVSLLAADGTPIAAVRAEGGKWHARDGKRYTATATPAAIDAWTHLHVEIDTTRREYRVVIQPIGEAPQTIFRGTVPESVKFSTAFSLELECQRDISRADGPAVDNVRLTRSR